MHSDEMEIVRALSVRLDPDTVMYVTYQYHTEKDPADPAGKRNAKAKSRYRMVGRVEKVKDVEAQVARLHSDAERTKPWKWPADPSWDGRILYMKDSTAEGFSNWLRLKLRKAVSPEEALRLMAGYRKDAKAAKEAARKGRKLKPEEAYSVFAANAVYETEGYRSEDGTVFSLKDFDVLRSKAGQTFWKEIRMKTVGPSPLSKGPSGE